VSTLASDPRGEVLSSVERDGVALTAQAAAQLATAANALAQLANQQAVTAEQRADTAITDAQLAISLANEAIALASADTGVSAKLSLTGGTLTGYLTLHADPINTLHAAPKAYVDTQFDTVLANYWPKTEVYTQSQSDNLYLTRSNPVVGGGPLTLAQDAASPMHAVTLQQANAALASSIPSGVIVMWSGSTASIPAGWALCNGLNGTPDLRNRFVIGAGSAYNPGTLGGAATHAHTITVSPHVLTLNQIPSHSHPVNDPGHAHSGSTSASGDHEHIQRVNAYDWDTSTATHSNVGGAAQQNFLRNSTVTTAPAGNHAHTLFINGAGTNISLTSQGGSQSHAHGATASDASSLPPFYALAYIQKL
jgi:hypothetical protein